MSQNASEAEACQAVTDFVSEGKYPESENVIASEFPPSALSKELELLSRAREQVEVGSSSHAAGSAPSLSPIAADFCSREQKEISFQSRDDAFDADGWMSQAKQLHADIERSRFTAREIVAQHEKTGHLKSKVVDAAAKVELIHTEIAFNNAVTSTLEEVQRLCKQLDAGRLALSRLQVSVAIDTLESTTEALKKDSAFTSTNLKNILSRNIAELQQKVVEHLRMRWDEQLKIDKDKGKFQVEAVEGKESTFD